MRQKQDSFIDFQYKNQITKIMRPVNISDTTCQLKTIVCLSNTPTKFQTGGIPR
jgi:hypothetical protein